MADEEAKKEENLKGETVEEKTTVESAAEQKEAVSAEEKSTEEVKPAEKKKTEEAPAKEVKEKKPELSGKFKDLIKQIEGLTVLELAKLVKELEERFGVSASALPTAVAGVGIPTPQGVGTVEEEKVNYTIMLTDAGAQKIAVIKALREIRPDLGLKEAKDLVDGAPKEVKKDAPKAEAEEAKKKIEAAGGKVELK